ncbi:tryptophan synthase, alpha chain [Candidatus Ruthia magnifica str. Cm (Calyptogena magnifica)]|uniref:Tryptophan synthase alpha chain n=1 Tax=Ruthia magnifica subsp. Calyptogena magnifica TaxID=413404 RepID=TRPA_RUTMC|nr:tryptophan synthase subunit alpha [Candidatus Ruthturnera calyptogenae]A1AXS3.1 RecName: Full=Tryptophan synthase alpha chain [Candidatus Ruthia magnifica str. Cm (Calyptogena magnifica)]ABL02730.1 tryptophan synthase, alpha chain [Candidatus Ruthia magnifica str. Cm (Calyptogena magnifica)]
MSRLSTIFTQLPVGKKVFIPFITAGDSGLDNTFELMQVLVKNGADVIELGVPFSDPIADGPIIAKSHERAVADGVGLCDVLSLVKKFRQSNDTTAIVLMGYLNPIEAFGYQAFANAASESAVDGVLVVDMPPEEAHDLKRSLDDVNIDLIFLVALTTTDERLAFLATIASGFIYFISLKGVTGAEHLDVDLVKMYLLRVRKMINLPIGVGFGIKNAKSAKAVSKYADAVIVGSLLVAFVEQYANDRNKMLANVGYFADEISTAIK